MSPKESVHHGAQTPSPCEEWMFAANVEKGYRAFFIACCIFIKVFSLSFFKLLLLLLLLLLLIFELRAAITIHGS
jgi:hypothetical protein